MKSISISHFSDKWAQKEYFISITKIVAESPLMEKNNAYYPQASSHGRQYTLRVFYKCVAILFSYDKAL